MAVVSNRGYGCVRRTDQQGNLRATKDDSLGAARRQIGHDPAKGIPRARLDPPQTELPVNHPVHMLPVGGVRHDHFQAVAIMQAIAIKRLLRGIARLQQTHPAVTSR